MSAKLVDPVDYRDEIDKKWISEGLLKMMREVLTEREYIVLVSKFLNEMPIHQIARRFNVSISRIHDIKLNALRKLRGQTAYRWMVKLGIPEAENSIWNREREDFPILIQSKVRNVTNICAEELQREESIATSSWDEYQRVILAKIVLGEVKTENVHF